MTEIMPDSAKLPELAFTRGDGVPLPDQEAARREFLDRYARLGPIKITPLAADDWRMPYRSMDASGGPETCGAVAQAWIEDVGRHAMGDGRPIPTIDSHGDQHGLQVLSLYQGTILLAVATIFRDEMNFAVLVRWMAMAPSHSVVGIVR